MTARLLARCAEARGDWAAAARMLARSAKAAGEQGLLSERWQIEAGLARVARRRTGPRRPRIAAGARMS